MRSKRFIRAKSLFTLGVTVLALAAVPAVAHADVVAEIVNSVLLPRSCSITANAPQHFPPNVRSSGRVDCATHREAIVVEVCTQFKQALVSEDVTWQPHGACGQGSTGTSGGTSANASTANRCLPGNFLYRTVITGEIHENSNVIDNGTGIAVSSAVAINCLPPE